jgi:hypothetical protein
LGAGGIYVDNRKQTRHRRHAFRSGSPFRSASDLGCAFSVHRIPASGIERAEIVAKEVASSLVTIGTLVQFIDHKSHRISEGRLAFPEELQATDAISILSPLGSALLGLGPGQSIDWIDEAGQDHRLTVVAVLPPGAQARARR